MRCVLALILLAGCGRLGFSNRVDHDAATSDGRPRDGSVPQAFTVYVVSSDGTNPGQLFTLELSTGALTQVGTFSASFGVLGGLAYWDANTLYATGTDNLVKITLSPFAAVQVSTMSGTYSALEQDGAQLFGIEQTGDSAGRFTEASASGPIPSMPLGVDALGGDLTQVGGVWYWITNAAPAQLFTLDAGGATPIGSGIAASPFIAGMTSDAAGNLYVTSNDTDSVYPLDTTTGQLGAPIALTLAGASFDLQSGDMTRTP